MKHNIMQVIYSEKINIRWLKFIEQKIAYETEIQFCVRYEIKARASQLF